MKMIGKGAFTKAFLAEDKKTVYLKSNDVIKEIMCLGWFPDNTLFPTVELSDREGYDYKMIYYPRCRSLKNNLKPDQWKIYKQLRDITSKVRYSCKTIGYDRCIEMFLTLDDNDLREIMIEALDACVNADYDIGFEISPRNVAVHNGNLILLDCFFVRKDLIKSLTK